METYKFYNIKNNVNLIVDIKNIFSKYGLYYLPNRESIEKINGYFSAGCRNFENKNYKDCNLGLKLSENIGT